MNVGRIVAFAGGFCLPLMGAAQQIDHSRMDHSQGSTRQVVEGAKEAGDATNSSAVREPRTPIPVLTDTDRQAAIPASGMHMAGDDAIHSYSLLNRLEGSDAGAGTGISWEGQGWVGKDSGRLWWRTEGDRIDGRTESASLDVLYGQAISPWWDWVAGVRGDFEPGKNLTFAAFGVQGLAPQWFELSMTGYVGSGGRTMVRFEAEYELLLTNRLILQPLLHSEFQGKSDAARGIGAGLATSEAGLRLRYEMHRRFAPYVGIVYERAFGKTADLRRRALEDVANVRAVAGVRIWF